MRNPRNWTTLAVALAVAAAAVAPAAAATAGRVIATVTDPAGEPLEGVLISLVATDREFRVEAETNRKGRAVMQLLDASWSFRVELRKEGYLPLDEPIDPIPGDVLRKDFVLQPGAAPQMEIERLDTRTVAARLYNEGIDLLQSNRLDEAIPKFRGALEEQPELALAHAALARIHLVQGDFDAALAEAQIYREAAPENPESLKMIYDAYWGLGDREASNAILDEMVARDPGRGTAARVYNIGVEAVRAQDLEEARRRFLQALEIYPELSQAYLPLGQIEVALDNSEAALEWANRHLELSPGDSRALLVAYRAQTMLGNPAEAEALFEQLKQNDADSTADLFYRDGTNLFNAGQTQLATANFQRVLELVPDHARGHYMLGLCYASAGEIERAKEALQRFLELAPDDPEAALARQMVQSL